MESSHGDPTPPPTTTNPRPFWGCGSSDCGSGDGSPGCGQVSVSFLVICLVYQLVCVRTPFASFASNHTILSLSDQRVILFSILCNILQHTDRHCSDRSSNSTPTITSPHPLVQSQPAPPNPAVSPFSNIHPIPHPPCSTVPEPPTSFSS
mgnify:CR=1 FL=1